MASPLESPPAGQNVRAPSTRASGPAMTIEAPDGSVSRGSAISPLLSRSEKSPSESGEEPTFVISTHSKAASAPASAGSGMSSVTRSSGLAGEAREPPTRSDSGRTAPLSCAEGGDVADGIGVGDVWIAAGPPAPAVDGAATTGTEVAAGGTVAAGTAVGLVTGAEVGAAVGEGVGVAVGGALASKRTSSTTSMAKSAPRGRSIARTFALCASAGVSSGPVVTAVNDGAGPATTAESWIANCAPLPSPEAYQATRIHAASASESGRSRALASYHCPGVTRTV